MLVKGATGDQGLPPHWLRSGYGHVNGSEHATLLIHICGSHHYHDGVCLWTIIIIRDKALFLCINRVFSWRTTPLSLDSTTASSQELTTGGGLSLNGLAWPTAHLHPCYPHESPGWILTCPQGTNHTPALNPTALPHCSPGASQHQAIARGDGGHDRKIGSICPSSPGEHPLGEGSILERQLVQLWTRDRSLGRSPIPSLWGRHPLDLTSGPGEVPLGPMEEDDRKSHQLGKIHQVTAVLVLTFHQVY